MALVRSRCPQPFGRVLLGAALLLAGATFHAEVATAEAALAVGLPADVARQGLAVGWAINQSSRRAAEAEALRRCRELKEPPQATRDLCRVVESFDGRCMALAVEPKAGTKGIGWAVAKELDTAREDAMDDCMDSAGQKRRDSCRIALARCDGR